MSDSGPGISPYDTVASAALRVAVEVVAWVAGPWAAFELTDRWWVAVLVGIALLTLPAVFSTTGDKHQVVVATPGPIRLVIELVLDAAAIVGAWVAWPRWLAVVVLAVVIGSLVTGLRRWRWLAAGAPPVDSIS